MQSVAPSLSPTSQFLPEIGKCPDLSVGKSNQLKIWKAFADCAVTGGHEWLAIDTRGRPPSNIANSSFNTGREVLGRFLRAMYD